MYSVLGRDGNPLDAHFDVVDGAIVYFARGGTKGTSTARNSDYKAGLVRILESLNQSSLRLQRVYVDSSRVQNLSIDERTVLTPNGHSEPIEAANEIRRRAAAVGRAPEAAGGNGTKRLRLVFFGNPPKLAITSALPCTPTDRDMRSLDRLPAATLKSVDARYIFDAVEQFRFGNPPNPFGPSTDYDIVLEDGTRLPPKAVFGLAASMALGFDVLPRHFSGGLGTPCFQALEAAGLEITPKGERSFSERIDPLPPSEEEEVWTEGGARIAGHLRRERHRGLAPAKRRAFRHEHGKLFCERCGLDPCDVFGGADGEACMEVHHKATAVSDMEQGHQTRLEDTELLCANCHRVEHHRLRNRGNEQ